MSCDRNTHCVHCLGIDKRNTSAEDANATHAFMFKVNQYVHFYMCVLMYNDDGLVSIVVVMSKCSLPKVAMATRVQSYGRQSVVKVPSF